MSTSTKAMTVQEFNQLIRATTFDASPKAEETAGDAAAGSQELDPTAARMAKMSLDRTEAKTKAVVVAREHDQTMEAALRIVASNLRHVQEKYLCDSVTVDDATLLRLYGALDSCIAGFDDKTSQPMATALQTLNQRIRAIGEQYFQIDKDLKVGQVSAFQQALIHGAEYARRLDGGIGALRHSLDRNVPSHARGIGSGMKQQFEGHVPLTGRHKQTRSAKNELGDGGANSPDTSWKR